MRRTCKKCKIFSKKCKKPIDNHSVGCYNTTRDKEIRKTKSQQRIRKPEVGKAKAKHENGGEWKRKAAKLFSKSKEGISNQSMLNSKGKVTAKRRRRSSQYGGWKEGLRDAKNREWKAGESNGECRSTTAYLWARGPQITIKSGEKRNVKEGSPFGTFSKKQQANEARDCLITSGYTLL